MDAVNIDRVYNISLYGKSLHVWCGCTIVAEVSENENLFSVGHFVLDVFWFAATGVWCHPSPSADLHTWPF